MSALLDLCHVHVQAPSCGTSILRHVSFQLHQGDFMILLGANGSGKSSLMKILCGLSAPTSGEVLLNGRPLHKLSQATVAEHMRTLTQDPGLSTFGDLTVRENCRLAQVHEMDQSALQAYLHDFHPQLPHKLESFARTLSGGQRQSLALAMGLLRPLTVLLLDEHTSALDPGAAQRVMRLTAACATRLPHAAIVMATHRLDDALQVGNRLMLLREGTIAYQAEGDHKRRLTKQDLVELY